MHALSVDLAMGACCVLLALEAALAIRKVRKNHQKHWRWYPDLATGRKVYAKDRRGRVRAEIPMPVTGAAGPAIQSRTNLQDSKRGAQGGK